MDKTLTDRRIRRTQKLLKESLIELMSEKDFKDITIKDITEHADLNRGTFYLHYADTYELLKAVEDGVTGDLQSMIDSHLEQAHAEQSLVPVLLPVIRYIVKNEKLCRNLFENDYASDFHTAIHSLIYQNGYRIIEQRFRFSPTAFSDYFFEFVTYGLIGVLRKWINGGMRESEDELARIGNDAVMSLARTFFGAPA